MIKNGKKIGSIFIALLFAVIVTSNVFAASSVNTPTKKYMNNTAVGADDAVTMSNITITESVISSFGSTSGGKFTIKIPADLTLYPSLDVLSASASTSGGTTTSGNGLSKSTSVFGSSSNPHGIYFAGSGFKGTLWIYETSDGSATLDETGSAIGILRVYKRGITAGAGSSSFQYGTGQTYGSAKAGVAKFSDPTTVITSAGMHSTINHANNKVGQIYYNGTTGEIVMTLAAKGQSTSFLESIVLEGLKLIPANTTGSGDQDFTLADGNAAGSADLLGVSGATLTMANLTTTPLVVSGAASSTVPPTIPAGSSVIDGQAMGQLKISVVGTETAGNNVLTVSLDNGAVFHSAADTSGAQLNTEMTIAGTAWNLWEAARTTASLVVNSAGKLVITLGTSSATQVQNQAVILIPRSTTTTIIDTSGITVAGDITATVAGTGTDFDGFSGTAVVADSQLKGTTISFKESSGATELSTLYTGRTVQTTGDKLSLAELAPTTLFDGGSIVLTLDQGAKFTTAVDITSVQRAAVTGTYSTSNLVLPNVVIGAASATGSSLVTTPSATNAGQYYYGGFSFNLTSATAGPLGIAVSGTAGASGAITIATIMDATASTAGTVDVVPSNIVNIPAITITEQKAGALAVGKIGLKFPTGYTLDVSNATVTATVTGGTASSNVTIGSVDTGDENYMYISVGAVSQTSTGPYTIVISGIEATTTSAVVSSSVKIGGASSGDWTSDAALFSGNTGAKPTAETVSFGSIVSATVPYFGTPVVNGTTVTQTFIPAGNDIGLVGDVYVFTSGQYHDGTDWTATETPYSSGAVLGSTTVVYDTASLAGGSKVYLGYGKGLTGTYSTMNTNATFVLSYTTAATVPVAVGAGAGDAVTATINTSDTYDVTLTTTNAAGATPTQEWIAYQVIVSGTASGWWFMTPTGSVQYTAGMDLTTVQYPTAAAGSIAVGQFKLGTYLPTAGDQLILAYVYSVSGIDLADPTSYVVENVVTMTVQ